MVRVNNETGRLDDMKGRTEKEGSDPAKDTRADTASRRGKRESRRGGKHGDRQDERLMERILAPENLAQAWKRVRANKGGSGHRCHEPRRVSGVLPGALAEDSCRDQERDIPSGVCAPGIHPETRWDATPVGGADGEFISHLIQ